MIFKALPSLELWKPPLRAIKYSWLRWFAEQQACWRVNNQKNEIQPVTFIIGCGRSGTTILGHVLSQHPQVNYLFEPYHLWAAIDRRTDVLNLFHHTDACLFMDDCHYSEQSQARFNRLIGSISSSEAKLIIEKTPLNALRIGYLEALAPGSKFIHLVRDGMDVCNSINQLATANAYKITGKPNMNQWWGVDSAKWKTLVRDGITAGYYADEVKRLDDNLSMGAYEWLISLQEVDRWRNTLGVRLQELTYEALTTDPQSALRSLCNFLELQTLPSWLDETVSIIRATQRDHASPLSLPLAMCRAFNYYQERYGFRNRAECDETEYK